MTKIGNGGIISKKTQVKIQTIKTNKMVYLGTVSEISI